MSVRPVNKAFNIVMVNLSETGEQDLQYWSTSVRPVNKAYNKVMVNFNKTSEQSFQYGYGQPQWCQWTRLTKLISGGQP